MTPDRARAAPLGLVEALLLLAGTIALLASVGGLLQLRFGVAGLFATEVLVVALPTLAALALWARRGSALGVGLAAGISAGLGLGLSRSTPRGLLGGALVGAGGFYLVAAGIEPLVDRWLPVPPALREQMRELVVPGSGARPLIVDLLVLVAAPAICEELLFRGALLSAFRPLGAGRAVLASALAFGVFHLSLYKLVPTAALGLLAGLVALRARSVLPAMALHFVNNALVVFLVRRGLDDPPPVGSLSGLLLTVVSIGAIALGATLSLRASPAVDES